MVATGVRCSTAYKTRELISGLPRELPRQRVHAPEPPDAGVVHAVFEGVQSHIPKHLIISLLSVEEVPITAVIVTWGLGRVCGGAVHGAKIGIFRVGKDIGIDF